MSDLHCISCPTTMLNFMGSKGHQPDNGLSFVSYGNYGSTVFDPMDGTYIQIAVCDECLKKAIVRDVVSFSDPSERESILSEGHSSGINFGSAAKETER